MLQRNLLPILLLTLVATFASAQPVAPTLVSPGDGYLFINRPPDIDPGVGVPLAWNDVAGESGFEIAVRFLPYGDSGGSETRSFFASADAKRYNLVHFDPQLTVLELGRYFWKVRGFVGPQGSPTAVGPWSEEWSFHLYADFPFNQLPDAYPRDAGDGKIDYRDVLAFATQWHKTSGSDPGGTDPYNPNADYDHSGRVDAQDLLGLITYFGGGEISSTLPQVNIIFPHTFPVLRVPLSSITSGNFIVEVWWDRVPAALGYIVRVEFNSQVEEKFVLNPSAAGISTVTTSINEFIVIDSLYNVKVAAVDKNFIRGEWSDYRRVDVPNDGSVTPTPTPVLQDRTLDAITLLYPPEGQVIYQKDLRLVPFEWTRATRQGTPIPENDVRYRFILGIENGGAPNGIQIFALDRYLDDPMYVGEPQTGLLHYYWSIRAEQISTGEFSPSLVDADFTPVPDPADVPYYGSYRVVGTPIVPIPGNITSYRYHRPRASNYDVLSASNADFFAFALAWRDPPGQGKTFAQLADLDNNGQVDQKDLLSYVSLYRGGNLLFPDPELAHAPVLVGPADGVVRPHNNIDVFFEWEDVPGATHYQVVVYWPPRDRSAPNYATAEAFYVSDRGGTRIPWKTLTGGVMQTNVVGDYYWKVRALDDERHTSAFSEWRRLTIIYGQTGG